MTFEGPGAIHWVPARGGRREFSDLAAGALGFVLGIAAAGVMALATPRREPPPPRPYRAPVYEEITLREPPDPPFVGGRYSHAAATGQLHLPKDFAAPCVGILVLGFAGTTREE